MRVRAGVRRRRARSRAGESTLQEALQPLWGAATEACRTRRALESTDSEAVLEMATSGAAESTVPTSTAAWAERVASNTVTVILLVVAADLAPATNRLWAVGVVLKSSGQRVLNAGLSCTQAHS